MLKSLVRLQPERHIETSEINLLKDEQVIRKLLFLNSFIGGGITFNVDEYQTY